MSMSMSMSMPMSMPTRMKLVLDPLARSLSTGRGTTGNVKPPPASVAAALGDTTSTTTSTTTTEAALAEAEDLLKAPFAKATTTRGSGHKGIFPWVSSLDLPDRLIPGKPEYDSKGLLLGGNLTSSNPRMDGFATACFFLRVPFWDLVFFRKATEQDLADSMAYAFEAAILQIAAGDGGSTTGLKDMMEATKLAKLFESASEFGKDSLQVKLETTPILYNKNGDDDNDNDTNINTNDELPEGLRDGPRIVSLFVFPFLSRDTNQDPNHIRKYSKLLNAVGASGDDDDDESSSNSNSSNSNSYSSSLEPSRELMEDFRQKGVSENTVVCQVLVPCKETFWVKDVATGQIIQGDAQQQRTVIHLVRFEQVTKTHIVYNNNNDSDNSNSSSSSRFFPFRHELGEWKITDIDDLCDGNLLL